MIIISNNNNLKSWHDSSNTIRIQIANIGHRV